jgi:hypothetical protein
MKCRSGCRIEFVLDQSESHIDVSAVAQNATDLPKGANQLATFADSRFGEKDSEGFLKASAPNASIVNGIRMVADQHLGEQGNEFLEPALSNREKSLGSRVGFNIGVDCAHDPLVIYSIAQLAQLFRSQEPMEGARGTGRQAVDFDTAESAFFQLDFEPYLFLTSDQKRRCITEEGIVAD